MLVRIKGEQSLGQLFSSKVLKKELRSPGDVSIDVPKAYHQISEVSDNILKPLDILTA